MINDREGHASGDHLLKKAVSILRLVFPEGEIYRAGGDEFMILCLNETAEEVKGRIARLQEICDQDGKVSFSVGYCFDDAQIDILKGMSLADKRMYEDKERYYQKYPEKKYR
jgi:diguanylate cyclase (GGDEF)-like protein